MVNFVRKIVALLVGKEISIFSRLYTDYMEFNEMMSITDSKYLRERSLKCMYEINTTISLPAAQTE